MKNVQSGFTLIELVVVLVILGILGVTAVPRFIDLSNQAEEAAADGIAGAISSGMAVNYAACAAGMGAPDCVAINQACSSAEATSVLSDSSGLSSYTFTAGTAADSATMGASGTCTITSVADNTVSATYTSIDTDTTSP